MSQLRRSSTAALRRKVRKKQLLKGLWDKHGGVCQRCGCPTRSEADARRLGWEVFPVAGVAVTRDGYAVGIATVQHIAPLCAGGTHDPSNLTLYCQVCNTDDDKRFWGHPPDFGASLGNDVPAILAGREARIARREAWQALPFHQWADDGGRGVAAEDV